MRDFRSAASAAHPPYVNGQRDEKAWARRIMYRAERQDQLLMPIQVDFAKRALDIKDAPKE